MEQFAVRSRILEMLDQPRTVTDLAEAFNVSDARLLWHLRQMRDRSQVESKDDVWWSRSSAQQQGLQVERDRRAFPQHVVDDFEDAMIEAEAGIYGPDPILAGGEHRGRLSAAQAAEFNTRLMELIEEYFAPGQGDQAGIKHGFHWVLTPIDLHPLDDDR